MDTTDYVEDVQDEQPAGPLPSIDGRPRFELLTGTAGTGKTFLAREIAAQSGGTLAATTGIAAINLGEGVTTINSLLGFFDTASLRDQWTTGRLTARLGWLWSEGLTRLVIDEVSMMDGEQLSILCYAIDELEKSTRRIALSLTLVGDFCQLPPVNASFAFESEVWERFTKSIVRLEKIRRQTDRDFIEALQAVRRGDAAEALKYFGPRLERSTDPDYDGPTILAKNVEVDKYNLLRHSKVHGEKFGWTTKKWVAEGGKPRGEWKLIPDELQLKAGALVMVLANLKDEDEDGKRKGPYIYVNGDLADVVSGEPDYAVVKLRRSGAEIAVYPVTRENLVKLDKERRKFLRETNQEHLIRGDSNEYEAVAGVTYMPLRLAYATTCHKCVTPDTRVAVQGRGVIPIEHVRPGDYVDTCGAGLARVKALMISAQPTFDVTTARGYSVTCSAEHRWVTTASAAHLVRTAKLKGCSVRLSSATAVDGTQEVSADVAWWIGAVLGDGCVTDKKEGQVHFTSVTPQLRDRFMKVASQLGGRPNTRRDNRGCHLTSMPVRLRLELWGMDYGGSLVKRVPRVVWESGRVAWAACLRGLFDTDGSMSGSRLVYATRSSYLAADVQLLLLLLGIPTTRGTYQAKGRYAGPYYHIRVGAEGVEQFRAVVGFCHPEKRAALTAWKPNRLLKPFFGADTVVSMRATGRTEPVVDVELETVHELGFNGIVGSNSQGLTLDKVQVSIFDRFWETGGMVYVALSRARSAEGLRVVGSKELFAKRIQVDQRVRGWV